MYSLVVGINEESLKKFLNGHTVTINNNANGHKVKLEFTDKKVFGRLERNLKSGKGTRLNMEHTHDVLVEYDDTVHGGRALKSIRRAFKKVGRAANKAVNNVEKVANVSAQYIHKNAGQAVETAKDVIPQGALGTAMKAVTDAGIVAGLTMAGQPELIPFAIPAAHLAVNSGVSTFYANDFSKKQTKKNAINSLKTGAINGAKESARELVVQGLKNGSSSVVNKIQAPTTPQVPVAVPVADVVGYGMRRKAPKKAGGSVAKRKGPTKQSAVGGSMLPIGGSFRELGKGKGGIPVY